MGHYYFPINIHNHLFSLWVDLYGYCCCIRPVHFKQIIGALHTLMQQL